MLYNRIICVGFSMLVSCFSLNVCFGYFLVFVDMKAVFVLSQDSQENTENYFVKMLPTKTLFLGSSSLSLSTLIYDLHNLHFV